MAYIVVVDDTEDLANAMAFALREDGHEVLVRLDTASGLAEMKVRIPDLTVLDCMFPGDDFGGFELARAMARHPELKRVPILMLTGVNMELGLGVTPLDIDNSWLPVADFMDKPVKLDALVAKVRAMLQASECAAHPRS
jgi:DNA-binding response OmpR family regulator